MADFEKLMAAIKAIDSPKTYFFRVEKDIVVNHVQIIDDVKQMISDFKGQLWYEFGKSLGDMLEKVFLGSAD